jgi:hypothetical protein
VFNWEGAQKDDERHVALLDHVGVLNGDALGFLIEPPMGRRGSRLCLVYRFLELVDSGAYSFSSSVSEQRILLDHPPESRKSPADWGINGDGRVGWKPVGRYRVHGGHGSGRWRRLAS